MRLTTVRRLSSLGAMLAGLMMQTNAARASDVIGWMDVTPSGHRIEIAGRAYSAAPATVEYTLKIDRAGQSGRSATSQRGRTEIEPGQVARLGTTSVNFNGKDELTVILTLTSGGRTLSTSEIRLGGD
jgi:hypothetical protein